MEVNEIKSRKQLRKSMKPKVGMELNYSLKLNCPIPTEKKQITKIRMKEGSLLIVLIEIKKKIMRKYDKQSYTKKLKPR